MEDQHYQPAHRQPPVPASLYPVRPLPNPSTSNQQQGPYPPSSTSSSSSVPSSAASKSTWPTTPSAGGGDGDNGTRRPSNPQLNFNPNASGRSQHGKEGSAGSALSSSAGRPHSPLPPVPPRVRTNLPPSHSYPSSQQSLHSGQPLSPPSPHHPSSPSPTSSSSSHRAPLPPGSICTATADHEVLSVVKLAGLTSPAGIKERILTKLQIGDDEFFRYSFWKTRIGGGGEEVPLDDDEALWNFCGKENTNGSVVYVKQEHGPSGSGSGNANGTSGTEAGGAGTRRIDDDGWDEADISAAIAQSIKYANASGIPLSQNDKEISPISAKSSSRRTKSPSVSSRSDRGDGPNEFGEGGVRGNSGAGWSWPRAGEGHRATGSHGSGGAGGAGGLSPPMENRGRDRQGSLTPTLPDDFRGGGGGGGGGVRRQSEGEWGEDRRHEMTRRPSAGNLGGRDVILGPSGPVRLLPGPPPQHPNQQQQQQQQHHHLAGEYERDARQRTQTAPGNWAPSPNPQMQMPAPPQGYPRPPPPLTQPIRPLPTTTQPGPARGQPQYAPLPAPGMVAPYNMSIQIQYQTPNPPQPHSPYMQPPPRHPSLSTKSTGNLRDHYAQAFESDIRPTPSPSGNPVYRPPNVGIGHPGALGSRPPPPPPPAGYAQSAPIQQRPTFSPPQGYPPIFDPRSMSANRFPPPPPPPPPGAVIPPYPVLAQQPQPLHRPHTAGSQPPPPPLQNWPNPQRRATNEPIYDPRSATAPPQQPSRFPDVTGHIGLQPGQTLQQASRPLRRPSEHQDMPPHSSPSGRGPVAAHMVVSDPSRDAMSPVHDVDRYGGSEMSLRRESGSSRRESSTSGSAGGERRTSQTKEGFPKSLQAGSPSNGKISPRDSGSSFHSSTSSKKASLPPLAPSAPAEHDAYGGLVDGAQLYQSPPSSARSSTSAGGPFTPATDANPPIPTIQTPPTHPVFTGTFESFGDEDEGGTWVGKKAPTKPLFAQDLSRQRSVPALVAPFDEDEQGDAEEGTDTARAHEWAAKLMETFSPQGGERTMTIGTAPTLRPATAPVDKPAPLDNSSGTFSSSDFADDVEGDTFFPGHGPKPILESIAPPRPPLPPSVGVSLADEPASRSPTSDRRRPPLRIETVGGPPSPASDPPASTISTNSQVFEGSPLGKTSRKSAGADSDGSGSAAPSSSRRADRENRPARTNRLGDVVTLASPPLGRSASLADRAQAKDDWAFRPPVETVLEHLEVFFPEHASELDKPVFDAPSPAVTTPVVDNSPTQEAAPAPAMRAIGATGLGYKKSIRIVARDRKRNLLKASTRDARTLQANPSTSLLRRKSTKLFGSRLEEVTSAQIKQMDPTIPEADDPDNFSFKWIKGDLIGRGTYGKVYIAFNVTAGETIAVKQVELPKTRSDREDQRQQGMVTALKGEIELLKDLEHPNIVEYLGMEETVEHLSIFLEYVPGGSVGRILKTHGKFEEDIIRSFTFQVLSGLEYLHRRGILHRDLKADNILCDHEGTCKISDFGTSKRSADIYNNDADMSMQGTIFWMAPEVIHNEHKGYSAKADIWSVGCLCLEMLAGRRPWSQEQAIAAMFKIGAERRPPPVPADVHLSRDAEHFLGDCLKIEPDERPKAKQLMRHRFLELPDDWSFTNTALYRAIATSRRIKA